jgi:hypothetical protein
VQITHIRFSDLDCDKCTMETTEKISNEDNATNNKSCVLIKDYEQECQTSVSKYNLNFTRKALEIKIVRYHSYQGQKS